MKQKTASRLALLVATLVGVGIGYMIHWGLAHAPTAPPTPTATVPNDKAPTPVTVWTCSMHPEVRLPKPGLCPKCRMPLIPERADASQAMAGMRQFAISEEARALMDIETAPVERKFVTAAIRMVGKVAYDETRLAYITAWVPGRLDRLYVDYTGVPVKKGDHMVYLYSPELIAAQEELLQAIRAAKDLAASEIDIVKEATNATINAARGRLRLWGLTEEQIGQIEKRGKPTDHVTIYAPSSGIVIHKNAREGMYVKTGTRIYTVADLSQVWVKLDAYESDLMWLRYGQEVELTTIGYPGETFAGTISFIDPVLDPRTRTVKIRVNASNAHGKLRPEMFVKALVRTEVAAGGKVMEPKLAGKWICPMHPSVIKAVPGQCDICGMPLVRTESLGYVSAEAAQPDKPLVIPVSAALVTGTRAIVYVQVPQKDRPTYEGREIVLGPRAGDYYLVRSGLREGERVVAKGNFKIDSALQIQAKPSMMTPEGDASGRDHVGHAEAKPGKEALGDPAVELPPLFRNQLHAVLSAAEAVDKALAAKDLTKVRSAFAALEKAVRAADMKLLEGHVHMLWMEYSMRLINDGVEGKEAKTLKEAIRVAGSLAKNITSLRAAFELAHEHPAAPPKTTVSGEFRKQLRRVFDTYFAMQRALARDRFKEAVAAAGKGRKALVGVDMKLLSGADHEIWMKHAAELEKVLDGAAGAKDIAAARQAFALLSEQMAVITQRFGPPGGAAHYKMKCPMAFNNRGATWLQRDDKVQNPYFGAAMLQCGSVVEIIRAQGVERAHHGE